MFETLSVSNSSSAYKTLFKTLSNFSSRSTNKKLFESLVVEVLIKAVGLLICQSLAVGVLKKVVEVSQCLTSCTEKKLL